MALRSFIISPAGCHSCEGRNVPKLETHAVSVHEAISRERSGHQNDLALEHLALELINSF
ncbi:MAG: hypothetical protein EVG15_08290 [Candidatus Acididesulfobacter diazotrophicus]|uniref:Uncharacterized protein n=1 Tax=Candidatus Acididesulfobacter diazotrophicus TaxID=2597226 RepID=A0A519BLC5_9DELT|nr:MAG: hypothetical protein EVG15_08290 [Candidatus Acididesulfobacter diazotrophicus]